MVRTAREKRNIDGQRLFIIPRRGLEFADIKLSNSAIRLGLFKQSAIFKFRRALQGLFWNRFETPHPGRSGADLLGLASGLAVIASPVAGSFYGVRAAPWRNRSR